MDDAEETAGEVEIEGKATAGEMIAEEVTAGEITVGEVTDEQVSGHGGICWLK